MPCHERGHADEAEGDESLSAGLKGAAKERTRMLDGGVERRPAVAKANPVRVVNRSRSAQSLGQPGGLFEVEGMGLYSSTEWAIRRRPAGQRPNDSARSQ